MKKIQSVRALNEKLRDILNDNPDITEEEGFRLMQDFGVDVDFEKSIYQARKRKLAGYVARNRDDKGRRKAFASNNDSGETVYTNIDNETRAMPLTQIRTRLERQLRGISKSYYKARRRERKNIGAELISLFAEAETN